MKWKMWVIVTALGIGGAAWGATNDLSGLLQKGLFEEEANRNLEAAVQAYQSLVTAFDRDRKLAATAVFRLGECYRKLGKTNEAVLQYERIVREFADEATLATLSRQNLAGMGIAPAKTTPSVAFTERLQSIIHRVGADTASDSEETEIRRLRARTAARLAREEELYASLKKLSPSDLLKTLPTVAADSLLQELLQQLNLAEQNLVALKQDFTQDHPTVRTAATQVETLRKKAQERANGILAGLEVNVSALKASLASLEQAEKDAEKLRSVPLGRTDATGTIAPDDEETEIRRLQAMIKDSPDLLNAPGEGNLTPLGRAAGSGWLRVAKFLLDHGAVIDRPANNSTALHSAAAGGHKAMVELLLARGADANARDDSGRTALHDAAANGYLSVADALIQGKADLNARSREDKEGVTPLHVAATQGHPEMVAFLISKGAEVDARDASGMTALIRAAMHGHTEVLNKLLSAGAKPDIEDEGGMTRQQFWGGRAVQAKPDIQDGGGVTALSYAAGRGHLDSVKALLAAKANPNGGKVSPSLFWAVSNPECLKLLLEARANPNVKDNSGQTPLLRAIEPKSFGQPDFESAELLIKYGADVNLASDKGVTPLQMAVWAESIQMVSLLLTNHADVNAQDPTGRTALDLARQAESGMRLGRLEEHDSGRTHRVGVSFRPADKVVAREISALLRQHGAREDLQKPDSVSAKQSEGPGTATSVGGGKIIAGRIYISGQVRKQGPIDLLPNDNLTVAKAIVRAGGFTDSADKKKVLVVRASESGSATNKLELDMTEILEQGSLEKDVVLRPEDRVIVPSRLVPQ